MKNIFKIHLGVAALLIAFSVNAWSLPYPVSVGDSIKVAHVDTAAQYEGEYQVLDLTNGNKFGTFCLELNENIFTTVTYEVESIENYAKLGGFGGATAGQDPLSGATKWLYHNFLTKTIFAATGAVERDYAMQLAFWYLEDELNLINSPSALNSYLTSSDAVAYVTAALANSAIGDTYDVKVMNLIDPLTGQIAQSQLVSAVPEPGTMALLGAGLLGLAIFGKRRMNRNI